VKGERYTGDYNCNIETIICRLPKKMLHEYRPTLEQSISTVCKYHFIDVFVSDDRSFSVVAWLSMCRTGARIKVVV